MSSGNNTASVSISPNFSNNNLTLNGNIVPLDQSNIFKRTFLVIRIQESYHNSATNRAKCDICSGVFYSSLIMREFIIADNQDISKGGNDVPAKVNKRKCPSF